MNSLIKKAFLPRHRGHGQASSIIDNKQCLEPVVHRANCAWDDCSLVAMGSYPRLCLMTSFDHFYS